MTPLYHNTAHCNTLLTLPDSRFQHNTVVEALVVVMSNACQFVYEHVCGSVPNAAVQFPDIEVLTAIDRYALSWW